MRTARMRREYTTYSSVLLAAFEIASLLGGGTREGQLRKCAFLNCGLWLVPKGGFDFWLIEHGQHRHELLSNCA